MDNKYVAYYANEERLIPAQVHVDDLTKLYASRHALFMQMGLAPGLLAGKSILEIGPAQGEHARFILEQKPASYTFIEGNPQCMPALKAVAQAYSEHTRCDIHETLFETHQLKQQYDVVWCERTIECQQDPKGFLQEVLPLVAHGGVLLVTSIDTLSSLPDFLRYFAAKRLVNEQMSYAAQCQRLCPLFTPHLQTLKGMKKPAMNWVEENLLFPLKDKKFVSQGDILSVVEGAFQVTGTAPNSLNDWRWYQEVLDQPGQANARTAQNLLEQAHNLLDYRSQYSAAEVESVRALYQQSQTIIQWIEQHDRRRDQSAVEGVVAALETMIDFYDNWPGPTADSLRDYCRILPTLSAETKVLDMGGFTSMFGRGVQHMLLARVV
ncbi:class I SAM-dependent methyltransferase [Magnetococcus sp. PR-3]|uniref:class I SAM-dependent methyltransferase n=1 Tax=Magnetococcus sp. PR-3 TaxID=3120355 RepID=UPI002FCDF32C